MVDADYFATFGIPMLAGRAFTSTDRESSPWVVVINHKMADMFWPGRDPLGRTLIAGDPGRKFTVVGVAADGKYLDPDEPVRPFLYYALSQNYRGGINVIARTKGDPRIWVEPFAKALRGLGLKIMIQPVTFQTWMNLTLLTPTHNGWMCRGSERPGAKRSRIIGLFGSISYSVRERKKELGIFIALGARPWQLVKMVLRQTMLIADAGVKGCRGSARHRRHHRFSLRILWD